MREESSGDNEFTDVADYFLKLFPFLEGNKGFSLAKRMTID